MVDGAEGIRTPDPHAASVMLSQLSYCPKSFIETAWIPQDNTRFSNRQIIATRPAAVKRQA